MLNSDFNFKHYGTFYENMEQEGGGDGQNEEQKVDEDNGADEARRANLVGFANIVSEENLFNKMW